jgi:hypothetical protein
VEGAGHDFCYWSLDSYTWNPRNGSDTCFTDQRQSLAFLRGRLRARYVGYMLISCHSAWLRDFPDLPHHRCSRVSSVSHMRSITLTTGIQRSREESLVYTKGTLTPYPLAELLLRLNSVRVLPRPLTCTFFPSALYSQLTWRKVERVSNE